MNGLIVKGLNTGQDSLNKWNRLCHLFYLCHQ